MHIQKHLLHKASTALHYFITYLLWHVVAVFPLLFLLCAGFLVVLCKVSDLLLVFQVFLFVLSETITREKVFLIYNLCLQVLQLLLLTLGQVLTP